MPRYFSTLPGFSLPGAFSSGEADWTSTSWAGPAEPFAASQVFAWRDRMREKTQQQKLKSQRQDPAEIYVECSFHEQMTTGSFRILRTLLTEPCMSSKILSQPTFLVKVIIGSQK